MQKLPENTFAQLNADGHMEVIDMLTGNVVAVQKSREQLLIGDVMRAREVTLESGDKVWIEKGISENTLEFRAWKYSVLEAEAIACLVAEGQSLRTIAKKPGFPSLQIIRQWRTQHPDFEERLRIARKDRAEKFVDQAIQAADEAMSKDDAPAAKVKVETYKWAAQVDDPDMYGAKKASGDNAGSITIIIDTGIRRQEDFPPGKTIEAESRVVKEISEEQEVVVIDRAVGDF